MELQTTNYKLQTRTSDFWLLTSNNSPSLSLRRKFKKKLKPKIENKKTMSNRTFTMIKPDAMKNGHAGAILDMIIKGGFRIVALKQTKLSADKAGEFYRQFHYALFSYISHRIPEISNEVYRVDDAMMAGLLLLPF